MLDSDSDYEYPDNNGGAQSDASNDDLLFGKIALGVDKDEMKSYDGRSTPRNGSQYLMKVIAEKKGVPKVAFTDKLPAVLVTKAIAATDKDVDSINPNYLERFLKLCSAYDGEGKLSDVNTKLLPSKKWREQGIANFSNLRLNLDRWKYKIEASEIFLDKSVNIPQSSNPQLWQKFCYGSSFAKFASSYKLKTPEERLAGFFVDLYDPSFTMEEDPEPNTPASVSTVSIHSIPASVHSKTDGCSTNETGVSTTDHVSNSADSSNSKTVESHTCQKTDDKSDSADLISSNTTVTNISTPQKDEVEGVTLGHRPLMSLVLRLNHTDLESLVKWNLAWLKEFGFVNECQGQWLYAILTCISKPVDPSVMSDLRNIARILINVRNSVATWNPNFDNNNCDNNVGANESVNSRVDEKIFDFINTLNLFIYIVTDYFQQKDLIMHL